MLIKNITIYNFQSYYGSSSLNFTKGLNIVIGTGGRGKSKLFNAFYWLLFGKIYITEIGWCETNSLPQSSRNVMGRSGYINMRALSLAEVNDTVTTSVQLEIEDDKGASYILERSATTRKVQEGHYKLDSVWDTQPNIIKVSFDTPTGTRVLNGFGAEDKIAELFPNGIRNYIWFQGESLENLINFRNKDTLKSAVKHISYFPYYEKLSEIISISRSKITGLETKKLREQNKRNSNVNELVTRIESYTHQIQVEEEKRKKYLSNIDMIKIALADDESKLKTLAGYTALVSKYNKCTNELDKLLQKSTELDTFQREKLPSLWILRGAEDMITRCKGIIEMHKEEEYTLPEKKYLDNPSRAKLQEILKDHKCFVCGTEFSENDAQYKYIVERLKLQDEYLREMEEYTNNMQFSKQFNMFVGKIEDYPDSLLISLSNIDKQFKDSEQELDRIFASRKRKKEEKEELDKELREIKNKNGIDPVKEAQAANSIGTNLTISRTNLESQQRKLNACTQTITSLKSQLRDAENDLEKLRNKDSSIQKVEETEWKNISLFLDDICKRVRESARKELLRRIEERANVFYAKFTEHDTTYAGSIKINDDYSIEFDAGLNTSNDVRKKMSIINAMLSLNQEAMGVFYPFITDAPTSDFDGATTFKYLLGVKDVFEQSIVMTKDLIFGSENYKYLIEQSNIGNIFTLDSELYCQNGVKPELHEVSTKIIQEK